MHRRAEVADAIVFLDLPRGLCLLRVLRRVVLGYGRGRSDVAPGCPERFDWAFLKWIWNYPTRSRAKTLKLLQEFPRIKVILNSRLDVRVWSGSGCPFS
jgi:adenylate kinase family enzyme